MVSRFPRVRSYELMVIFHPETEDEALAEQVDRVRSYITDVDGTITVVNRESPWGRRRLAYPIRHESRDLRDGIYALIYFDTEAGRTVDIERELKLNTRIIRYMLIQQSTPTMEPPAPVEEAPAPVAEGQTPVTEGTTEPAAVTGSEMSPGTPPEAVPTPVEPTVPATAGAPLAAEENIQSPSLDSSSAPSEPSETIPSADATLVETVADSETVPTAADLTAESGDVVPPDSAEPDGSGTEPETSEPSGETSETPA